MLALLLAATTYLTPPREIVAAFDAKPLPDAMLSPSRKVMALAQRRAQPTIAMLSQPMLRLAGARINPKNFGPHRTALIYAITLKKIADGSEVALTVPPHANLAHLEFSPDGSRLAYTNTTPSNIELWISGKKVADHLNATAGDPCDWMTNTTLVCKFVPANLGPAPAEPKVPSGPNVQENEGKTAQVATYEDMIRTAHDEDLFEYYFTSQLALVDAASGTKMSIAKPAIFTTITPFTRTYSIPSEYCAAFSKVALSITRAGSKIVMSASAPTRMRPLSLKTGARFSSRCAGIKVILRSAVIKSKAFSSRT